MKISILILLCVLSGVLGRMGGSGRYPRQVRVIGIPLMLTIIAFFLGVHAWWALLLFCGLSIGAVSTYHDYLGADNFWVHGAALGLASFPLAVVTGHWWMLLLRVIVLAVWMGAWSLIWKNAVVEEYGRYFPLPVSMLLI